MGFRKKSNDCTKNRFYQIPLLRQDKVLSQKRNLFLFILCLYSYNIHLQTSQGEYDDERIYAIKDACRCCKR